MVYQNYNHPSIIFWSAGNEASGVDATSQYAAVRFEQADSLRHGWGGYSIQRGFHLRECLLGLVLRVDVRLEHDGLSVDFRIRRWHGGRHPECRSLQQRFSGRLI